jgi:N-acetylglucosaminyl-diphospho-decaprenol L-rhamnosyltransferase
MTLASSPASADLTPSPAILLSPPRRKTAPSVPVLSVLIVNYRQWQHTGALVRHLRRENALRSGLAEVVVVDNHSPTHSLTRLLRRWHGVALRRWSHNRGFARAVNEAARLGSGDWLLLLNPDITLPEGFAEKAVTAAEEILAEDPHAGVIGFGLRHRDGSRQHSFGPFPTLFGSLARLLLPRARRKYHADSPTQRCRVPWVTGACLLVRRECFEDLGGLDESFFLYYEDVDLARRAADRGWNVWHEPSLSVTHFRPLHRRSVPAHLRLFTRHALLTYAARHWPQSHFEAATGIVRMEAWLREFAAACRQDADAVEAFATLRLLTHDLARGDEATARRRLERFVRRRESRLGH